MNSTLRDTISFPDDWDKESAYEDKFNLQPYQDADQIKEISFQPYEEPIYHSNRNYHSSSINSSYPTQFDSYNHYDETIDEVLAYSMPQFSEVPDYELSCEAERNYFVL